MKLPHSNGYNVLSYLDVLEDAFSEFLRHEGASEKTRKIYKTDTKHFLHWVISVATSSFHTIPMTHKKLISLITPKLIREYKHSLETNSIPMATTNRRLSGVQSFLNFCQTQGWIEGNPAIGLKATLAPQGLLKLFHQDLSREGAARSTIKNYLSDVRQFLDWLDKTNYVRH